IWGVAFDPNLDDEMIITVVATGFASDRAGASAAVESFMNQIQQASKETGTPAPAVSAAPAAAPAKPVVSAAPSNTVYEAPPVRRRNEPVEQPPVVSAPPTRKPTPAAPQPAAAQSSDIDDDDFYMYLKDIIKTKNNS
ncbi:MAG: hypothetical protein IKW76_07520, partial [Clostridia bacterium]|nr:hypothetical protein [Clostridia bacterium]